MNEVRGMRCLYMFEIEGKVVEVVGMNVGMEKCGS